MRKMKNGVLNDLSRATLMEMRELGFKSRPLELRGIEHHHHQIVLGRTPVQPHRSEQDTCPGWLQYWSGHSRVLQSHPWSCPWVTL